MTALQLGIAVHCPHKASKRPANVNTLYWTYIISTLCKGPIASVICCSVLKHRYLCCVQTALIEHCHDNSTLQLVVDQSFVVIILLTPFAPVHRRHQFGCHLFAGGCSDYYYYYDCYSPPNKRIESLSCPVHGLHGQMLHIMLLASKKVQYMKYVYEL